MGAFNSAVITKKGNALLAKVVAGVIKLEFTKIAVSADTLSGDLASKTGIGTIKQIAKVASIIKQNNASTKVSASFSNETLTEGYYVRSIGLYATDPDEGEILYSISVADESTATADWMPPYNGIGVSSLMVDLVTAVANASSVNLDVDPTALATVAQIMEVNEHLTALDNSITVTTEKTLNGSVAGGLKINKVCGKCEQGADPTPEVPQEIKSVEVSDISAYGKNRLKNTANSCTTNGVTFTVNEDGSVTADGTATASAVLHLNETSIENLHIGEYIPSGITGVRITHRDGTIYYLNKPFTVDDTVVEVAPFISIEGGVTVNSLVFKPMIRNASIENDTYEPYMGNSVTLSQPITLNGIGEVMDELTPVGVVRKFAKVVLDGSESWGVFNTDEADTYRRKTTSFVEKIKGAGLVMSDKYLAKTSLLLISFMLFASGAIYYGYLEQSNENIVFTVLQGVAILLSGVYIIFTKTKAKDIFFNSYLAVSVLCIFVFLAVSFSFPKTYYSDNSKVEVFKAVMKIIAVIANILLMISGAREKKLASINIGFTSVAALALLFVYQSGLSMIANGFLLLIFGGVLLAINFRLSRKNAKKDMAVINEEVADNDTES